MASTIGMAGWSYGSGRVAAFTRAINKECLEVKNRDAFRRLFLNSCLWACRNNTAAKQLKIFKTDDSDFDNDLESLFQSMGIFNITMLDPWYADNSSSSLTTADLLLLLPSYSAFDGTRMPDAVQSSVLNVVSQYGAGLVIGEWFHLLNSVPQKRSFTYDNASSIGDGRSGLIDASPLNPAGDNITFTDANVLYYTEEIPDESISFTLPRQFSITNNITDTPFPAHIVQIPDVKTGANIFWSTDTDLVEVTTTTTTTTTLPPETEDIHFKVADLNPIDDCGPYKIYLDGPNKNLFSLENGTELYLIKSIQESQDLSINVVAEDYFENQRFDRIIDTITIKFVRCDAPISLPKNGAYGGYSFKIDGNTVKDVWGPFAPTGLLQNFPDWTFAGKGTQDIPAVACIGGSHNDENVVWMQVNDGGEISAKIVTDFEPSLGNVGRDLVTVFVIHNEARNAGSAGNNGLNWLVPGIHQASFVDFVSNDQVSIPIDMPHGSTNFKYFSPSSIDSNEISFNFNVENPNALDENGDRIRGDIFILLLYKKDLLRSTSSDSVCGTFYFGTTTTQPPQDYDFFVFINNQIDHSSLSAFNNPNDTENALYWNNIAGTTITGNKSRSFTVTANPGYAWSNFSISQSSPYIGTATSTGTAETPDELEVSRNVSVSLEEMPEGGGVTTIILNADVVTTTTTTTTAPPKYSVTVEIRREDNPPLGLDNIYFPLSDSIVVSETKQLPAGLHTFMFRWNCEDTHIYYTADGFATPNPYEWNNRPTIDAIISQSQPDMVFLPMNTPSDVSATTISVVRGNAGQENQNFQDSGTYGWVYVPVDVPVNGGKVILRMGGVSPDAVTTTQAPVTTEAPEPCDYKIYVTCEQQLDCQENSEGNCVPSSSSTQSISYYTCCEITNDEIIQRIKDYNGSTDDISAIYSNCPSSNFEFLGDCLPKNQGGNCQQTVHSRVIDVIDCTSSSQNPLP